MIWVTIKIHAESRCFALCVAKRNANVKWFRVNKCNQNNFHNAKVSALLLNVWRTARITYIKGFIQCVPLFAGSYTPAMLNLLCVAGKYILKFDEFNNLMSSLVCFSLTPCTLTLSISVIFTSVHQRLELLHLSTTNEPLVQEFLKCGCVICNCFSFFRDVERRLGKFRYSQRKGFKKFNHGKEKKNKKRTFQFTNFTGRSKSNKENKIFSMWSVIYGHVRSTAINARKL